MQFVTATRTIGYPAERQFAQHIALYADNEQNRV